MPGTYDIFFSYHRHDLRRAQLLLDALESAGLRICRAQNGFDDVDSVTQDVRDGLASSKALVAFYSTSYSLSSACQEELIWAWVAAGKFPHRRVRVINSETGVDHMPALLRQNQAAIFPQDPPGLAAFSRQIRGDIASLDGVLGAIAAKQPIYYGFKPVHAKHFVGRTGELWDLHGKLTGNRIGIISGVDGQPAQTQGLGGNGKTLLTREYAIRFGPAYPGGVFWLNAGGNSDTGGVADHESREARRKDQLREFLREYSGNYLDLHLSAEGLKPDEIESALWRHITNQGGPCLWIVDDLPSNLPASDIERSWFAKSASASTLFTTRSREYASLGDHLDLNVLAPFEAVELLSRHRSPQSTEEAVVARIVEALGYHPLAVGVAGNYLAIGNQTFKRYFDDLSSIDRDAKEYGTSIRENLPSGHDQRISRTLFKSINLLGDEGLDFLSLASVLAEAPIHAELVEEVFESAGYGAASREHALEALAQVDSLGLCEDAGENARLVHPLISRAPRFRFRQGHWMGRFRDLIHQHPDVLSRRDARVRLLREAVVRVLDRRLSAAGDIRESASIANEIAHARHLTSISVTNEEDAALAGWIARHDYERGEYSGARKVEEQVLKTRARLLGHDHPDTLKSMNNLAQMLKAQGDLAGARQLEEEVLETRARLLGKEHLDSLKSMNNLAQTLKAAGDLAGARQLEEQVLETRARLLGHDQSDTLKSMNNLAQTLKAQGDPAGARQLEEQVLAARTRLLGNEHPDTLTSMLNLAGTLYAQGDLAGARRLEEQVLSARTRLLGNEHPDTLTSMNNLAGTLYAQGDLAGARQLEEQVLEAMARLLGKEHPDTLTAMTNLAQTLKTQGDLAGARQLEEQVLEAMARLLGKEHPDTLTAMTNLAQTLKAQGDLAGARQLEGQVYLSKQPMPAAPRLSG